MNSDFLPRLRNDEKRKIVEEHQGIHRSVTKPKIEVKDAQLHVQCGNGSGGNWRVKIFLFVILSILNGLIIIENQILSDLGTSLQEWYFGELIDELSKEHSVNQKTLLKLVNIKEELNLCLQLDFKSNSFELLEKEILDNDTEEFYLLREKAYPENNAGSSSQPCNNLSNVAQSLNKNDFTESELKQVTKQMDDNDFIESQSPKINASLFFDFVNSTEAVYRTFLFLSFFSSYTNSMDIEQSLLAACLQFVALGELVADEYFKKISYFCIKQMKASNLPYQAIYINSKLIERFDDEPQSRNDLAGTFIDLKRFSDAKYVVEENLKRWPHNGQSLYYYGNILFSCNNYNEAVHYLRLAKETSENVHHLLPNEYYSSLGEALIVINRTSEAREVFRQGVAVKIFPNEYQRPSTYIGDLKAQPIWTKEETPYVDILNILESNWQQIREEGLSALNDKIYYKNENENLIRFGQWQEFYFIDNGNRVLNNCKRVPFTCTLIQKFLFKHICYSGQVKFSVIYPGSHVKPHCGPHNARLRVHLGLKVPKGAKMRIVETERSWEEGKFLIFDDSFEHEVWHNGNGTRLVLIVDLWHPQVTDEHKKFIENL